MEVLGVLGVWWEEGRRRRFEPCGGPKTATRVHSLQRLLRRSVARRAFAPDASRHTLQRRDVHCL
jgi:hypothetical protein